MSVEGVRRVREGVVDVRPQVSVRFVGEGTADSFDEIDGIPQGVLRLGGWTVDVCTALGPVA